MDPCTCEWCATNREGFEAQFTEFDKHVGAAQAERVQKLGSGVDQASREQNLKSRREKLSANYALTWCNVTCAATLALDSALIASGATDNPFSATVSELVQTPAFQEDLKAAYFDEPNPDHWASAKRSVYGTTVVQVLATNLLAEVLRKQKSRNSEAEALKKQLFDLSAAEQAKRSEAPHTLHAEMRHELALLRKERAELAQERIEMREVMERLIAQREARGRGAERENEREKVKERNKPERKTGEFDECDEYVGQALGEDCVEGFEPSQFALQRTQAIRMLSDERPPLVRNFPPQAQARQGLKEQLCEVAKPFASAFMAHKQDTAESAARLQRFKSSSSQ